MEILEKYNTAVWHREPSREQADVFRAWSNGKEFFSFNKKSSLVMAADTETTGVKFGVPTVLYKSGNETAAIVEESGPRVFGISAAIETDRVHLFWGRLGTPLYSELKTLLETEGIKVFHNARYDYRVCEESGIKIAPEIECTYTMSRIYWDRRKKHSLQSLTEMLCPEISNWEEPVKAEMRRLKSKYTREGYGKDYVNYSFIDDDIMSIYSMTDSFMTLMLYQELQPKINNRFTELYEREKKVIFIINEVEKRGLAWDIDKAKRQIKLYKTKMKSCSTKLSALVGEHNPNSPKQVLDVLLRAGVPRKALTVAGKMTTGVDTLQAVANSKAKKYINLLLDYRSYTKILNTYLIPLTEKALVGRGIIYCSINPADTRTGRMASREPNLQNIPEPTKRATGRTNPVRGCFICRRGYTNYYFDYSQMEMVIFGLLSGEQMLLEAYNNREDIHDTMAGVIYGRKHSRRQRDLTKNINFGIIYGMGIRRMAKTYQMTESRAKELLKVYHSKFKAIDRWREELRADLVEQRYVEDIFGRRYHLQPGEAYKAINALVQGSCANIFKIALINVAEKMDWKKKELFFPYANILLPVHDELQIELKNEAVRNFSVREDVFISNVLDSMIMVPQVMALGLRLRVDVAKTTTNWADKENV